ncbi:MAG: toprim domain-containing protein [Candidatus Margulisiibacteriota bacterium]
MSDYEAAGKDQNIRRLTTKESQALNGVLTKVLKFLEAEGDNDKATKYLRKERGISIDDLSGLRAYHSDHSCGEIREMLLLSGGKAEEINCYEFMGDEHSWFFKDSLIVPIVRDGLVVNLYSRALSDRQAKHLFLKGLGKGIFNYDAGKEAEAIILTESIIDCMTLISRGYPGAMAVCGIKPSEEQIDLLRKLRGKKVFICFDNDSDQKINRGRKAALELGRIIPDARIVELPAEDKTKVDINSYFKEGNSKKDYGDLLRGAKRAACYEPFLDRHGEDELIYRIGELDYLVKEHSFAGKGGNITAVIELYSSKDLINKDEVKLWKGSSRDAFMKKCKMKAAPDIEKQLVMLEKALIAFNKKSVADKSKAVKVLSAEEKEEAMAFLRNPKLIDQVLADLESLGCVGENLNKLLLYLSMTSRKLKRPISLVVKGESSGGKSYIVEKVSDLFPEEDVIARTMVSAKALFYLEDKNALKHRVLIIYERNGAESSDYSIRSLQSEGGLSMSVVQVNPETKQMITVEKSIEGPVCYIETTTKVSIHPENETRNFDLFIDESVEQTKRIQQIQLSEYLPEEKLSAKRTENIINLHRNSQRLLETNKVMIPYVRYIEFSQELLRSRRDFPRFLALIETSALLHQYQREKHDISGDKYIIATLDDYAVAYKMAEQVILRTAKEVAPKTEQLVQVVDAMLIDISRKWEEKDYRKQTFTVEDITTRLDWSVPTITKYLKEACSTGAIILVEGGRGRLCHYRLISREKMFVSVLLTPEELKDKIEKGDYEKQILLEKAIKAAEDAKESLFGEEDDDDEQEGEATASEHGSEPGGPEDEP